jgi:phosphoribosylamine--glycine ligase
MKFRFISNAGAGMPVIWRLLREGHQVDLYTSKSQGKKVGRGIVQQVESWRKGLDDIDVFVFDMVGNGAIADTLKQMGKTVFGGSSFHDSLELDRTFGLRIMQEAGIEVPETHTFNFDAVKDAARFLMRAQERYVIKPHDNAATIDTHVSKTPEETALVLAHMKSRGADGDFELQRVIDGIEVSLEGWFDGTGFMSSTNITFEDKRLYAGDIGPNTGCMGSVVYESGGLLAENTLERATNVLSQNDYRGPIDINLMVAADGTAFGLEWSSRFGYNAISALMAILDEDLGELIESVANGDSHGHLMNLSGWGAAIRLSVPPYPSTVTAENSPAGLPILEVDHSSQYVAPADVTIEGRNWTVHGLDGVVLEISGVGNTIDEATEEAYSIVETVNIPNVQYRNDIGERGKKAYEELQKLGLVETMDTGDQGVYDDDTQVTEPFETDQMSSDVSSGGFEDSVFG